MKTFADYKKDAPNWITMANGEFYPDILSDACELYKPVLVMFGQLLKSSESSIRLLKEITDVRCECNFIEYFANMYRHEHPLKCSRRSL